MIERERRVCDVRLSEGGTHLLDEVRGIAGGGEEASDRSFAKAAERLAGCR